ncbi:unnamed protein product [Rotaria sp. Silwood1]|nr:unnamed protein product [Rotaria sp. Silwood1]CAF3451830.1 unnamed protein product [Rotaria sp. Silwood1]CAF4672787.1 unnamed protein product [Rotaria sp. Silwood1]
MSSQLLYGTVFNNQANRLHIPIQHAKATARSLLNLYTQAVNANIAATDLFDCLTGSPLRMPHEIADTIVDICRSAPYLKTQFISQSGLCISYPDLNDNKKRQRTFALMQSSLIIEATTRLIAFFSNRQLYLPSITKLIEDFIVCLPVIKDSNHNRSSTNISDLVEEMLNQTRIELDIETINRNSFMASEPLDNPSNAQTLTGKIIVNKKDLSNGHRLDQKSYLTIRKNSS